jgi:transcription elongation factor Elf1
MEKIYKCPKCDEQENLHFNYDYNQQHRPIKDVICNECGTTFDGNIPVVELKAKYTPGEGYSHYLTKPGFVERRMALGKHNNDKLWDEIYSEYSTEQYPAFGGPFTDALSFIDWLKQNYIVPEKIKI